MLDNQIDKTFMRQLLIAFCFLFSSSIIFAQQVGTASIKETSLSMPTYGFSDPDPIAKADNSFYPYFRFDGYSHKAVSKNWKVVEMENDHIKLSIFPEIGGKIWGAVEKSTGKEFIYYNHSVKFRNIAIRGPWVSGGIEFNFGIIGHIPSGATPVDYYIRENKDGSVSCFISSLEMLTRTVWSVEINLPKDKAFFTTRTTWMNSSSLEQPYYQWMNAGYKAEGNLEFCYPGQYYIEHGGKAFSFPIDEEGRELAWYNKQNFGNDKSYHVMGKYNDFYGGYWHDDNFGSVHYAPYDEKLGMKIYLWGLSRQGGIWEDLLTDTDGQYVELQSGRVYNQPASDSGLTPFKHYSFVPGTTDTWKEYWFPTKETEGISKVSPLGTLNVVRGDGKLTVIFSPIQKINTSLIVKSKEKELYRESLQLNVLETWKKEYELTDKTPLSIEIGDKELIWHEAPECTNINRPNKLPDDFDWNSLYGLYVQAEQFANQKQYTEAEKVFLQCLEKDAYYLPALKKLAAICYRKARYDEALKYAKTALSLNTYDGEANYVYGLINYESNLVDAKDGFSVASFDPAYRSAAYAMLGKCFLKEKDWKKALHYASLSLESNALNQNAISVYLAASRYLNNKKEAESYITTLLHDLPLNHAIRFEAALLSGDMESFPKLIRNEFPEETYLEIAEWYATAGLYDEALQLLSNADDHVVSLYWSAYIMHQLGKEQEAKVLLEKAVSLSPEWVFPFRYGTLKVFEWAQSVLPSWKTDYYTALLYWHFGNKEKARSLLDKNDDVPFSGFYQSRALLKRGEDKLKDLIKAESLDSGWRSGMALINYYIGNMDSILALQTAKKYFTKYPDNYMLGLKYAQALVLNEKYEESVNLLKKLVVLPYEGAYEGRTLYRESNLFLAATQIKKKNYSRAIRSVEDSKIWIENLGVGKPYDEFIDDRLENYIAATALLRQGKVKDANQFFNKIVGKSKEMSGSISNDLLLAIALKNLGNSKEAEQLLNEWQKQQSDSKIAQWAIAVYKGDKQKVNELLSDKSQFSGDYEFNLISEILQIID